MPTEIKQEYYITAGLLKKIADMTNFDKLNRNQVPTTFDYDNKRFIIIGSTSSLETGIISVSAHEVIKLKDYTGNLKPLYDGEHYNEMLRNNRPRGYNARLLKENSELYVMIDPMVKFYPLGQPKQLEIF